jgi:spore coat protein CotH
MKRMGDAWRWVHRLGLSLVLLVLPACLDEGPRLRPSALSQPIESCASAGSPRGFQLPVWDLFVVDPDWDAIHDDVDADVEVNAQVCIGGRLEEVGLELQGTSGRSRDKKSFKIKFRRDQELGRVGFEADSAELIDKVYLKAVWIDQSLIREAVAFDFWREMGYQAPRTAFANLRINGDYWGLYEVLEPVDGDYVERNGYPEDGHLYKATRKNGSRADFAPGRNLKKAFEDKTDETGALSRADLESLVDTLQHTTLDEVAFEREIDPIFPLDNYIDRMIWIAFTRNGDAVAQNYFLYNAPREGRDYWYQIPWDSDLCMGASWRDRDAVVPPDVSLMLEGGNYFGRRLTMVPQLRARYAERFLQVIDEVLPEPVTLRHIDRHASRVRKDLAADQRRWQRQIAPEEAFDVIRNFVSERPKILRAALLDDFAHFGEATDDNEVLDDGESSPDGP